MPKKKTQREVAMTHVVSYGLNWCDGCDKVIAKGHSVLRWSWDSPEGKIGVVHSHNRNTCIGNVMRKVIFRTGFGR